ncbi:Asp-tRNA(Asn)/Glu-tRNA(Gln) amidotransferase subunit GatA [Caldicoprobacter algeriensis]|uniref:Asp-tRNA(Asn)/Glu-tRNA(Gln) amidotransferase subunit GatA n=1 Tax=Caldicoprobacter algeriensis TaxID=699281 RepID=UPI0020796BAB|nr:Asp-tRNA(Asn)/Glu-tRNA(Gln) amidotransferase subunit GatA [Caldicoprobacter algeriensis]
MKLHEYTISQLHDLISKREISVPELTRYMLDRIESLDSKLECYITVTEKQAMEQAEKVQKMIDEGTLNSPLAGIPMGIKDNICTRGIPTTCASKMLSNFVPPYDAHVVKKLYDNGAVLLGKLNMDEFAMGSSTESSHFKKTKNPWDTERVPGGSSGGSAAAVAAGEAIYALGSDTGGSIRQPASFCGCVGLKPTYGLVSRFGLVAYASSFDQIGPLTKTVTDCALVLNAIAGHDPMDLTSSRRQHPDYTKALVNDVKGLKIGLPREFIDDSVQKDIRDAVLNAVKVFSDLGAQCEEISIPIMEYVVPTYYIIALAEASSNLARYDGVKFGYRAANPKDMLDFCMRSRSEGFGTEVKRRILLGTYVLSSGYYDAYYKKALKARTIITREFNKAFEKYDIIIGPVSPTTAYRIGEKINDPVQMYMEDIFTVPVNIAGLPAISIPCGFDSKSLPIGLQIIGKRFDETTVIRAAYTFEQNTDFHKAWPSLNE